MRTHRSLLSYKYYNKFIWPYYDVFQINKYNFKYWRLNFQSEWLILFVPFIPKLSFWSYRMSFSYYMCSWDLFVVVFTGSKGSNNYYFSSCAAFIFHFSIFWVPALSYRSLISGQTSLSWTKIGMTRNWMKPACPGAILVSWRSHIGETFIPFFFSTSPWWKNSWKSKSAH